MYLLVPVDQFNTLTIFPLQTQLCPLLLITILHSVSGRSSPDQCLFSGNMVESSKQNVLEWIFLSEVKGLSSKHSISSVQI